MKTSDLRLRVGLIGLGLEAYWPQFEGLQERLLGYLSRAAEKLTATDRTIVLLGLIDSSSKAIAAGHVCRQEDIDILLVYVMTYGLSGVLLPVIQLAKVPVILLNLAPEAAIDYEALNSMNDRTAMTREWLAFCSACPIPEIANVLRRAGIPFQQITGMLEQDPECWSSINEWLQSARIAKKLAHSRLGLMGHYYGGMLDTSTDLVQLSARFGTVTEMLEVDQLSAQRREVTKSHAAAKMAEIENLFDIAPDCLPEELLRAAITAAALDRIVLESEVDMLAYYQKGSGITENESTMSSIILGASMLTGRGIPIAGEYEVKNVLAMKIMYELGAGGSFTEFYAMDFKDDLVLMGHDGPGHVLLAQNRIRVRPLLLYHGKVGSGLSVEMTVKHGPVTLLSVVEDKAHGFLLLVAEGESVPGPILEIGNTNSRYRFSLGARGFVETWSNHGPAHHCAVGLGWQASKLRKLAELMGLGFTQIC